MIYEQLDTILKLVEIASIIGGGGLVAYRLGRTASRVEAAMTLQATEISTLKEEIKTLGGLVTQVAVQTTRLDMVEKHLDELRHGEGFVYPLGSHLSPPRKP